MKASKFKLMRGAALLLVLLVGMTSLGAAELFNPEGAGTQEWTYTEHTGTVYSVAVDNDGNVYSASQDDELHKIDSDGNTVWEYTGHTAIVYGVAVDGDGNVYSGSSDEEVHKIDSDGNTVWEYTGHSGTVRGVAVDNDGNVYSASQDDELHKIDSDGNNVWEYTGHTDTVFGVAVDSDGNVYSGSSDEEVHKIDSDGNTVWEYTGHTDTVFGVAVDGDGNVYSGSSDEEVHKIDSDGNNVWEYTGHTDIVFGVAVDGDGNVYSGSSDEEVHKIDSDGNNVWEYTGHTATVWGVAVDNDGTVYSASQDDEVHKLSFNQPPEFQDVSTSPDPPVIDTSSDVSFEASDDNEVSEVEVEWFRDGDLQESQTNSYSSASVEDTITDFYTPSEQGEHIIYFTATDDEGESTTETLEYTEIEEDPIAWIQPSDGDTFTYQTPEDEADVTFEWEVDWDASFTDGETKVQRLDDQGNFENLYTDTQSLSGTETFETDIGLEEGTHELRIYMEQNDGADTSVTDTRTITVEEITEEPNINLENPEDQSEINYPVEETDTDVSFEWVVEAFEEEGTTRLYLDDEEVFSDEFTATFASNPFENVESLSDGSYEWYVEAETENHLVTSDTRTFTVSEQEVFVDFSLNSPEDNEIITFPFGDQASIDYDGAVSSNVEGEISLLRDSDVLATETHPGDASVGITAEEELGEGLYDWNLEFDYETIQEFIYDDFESGSIDPELWEHDGSNVEGVSVSDDNPIDGTYSLDLTTADGDADDGFTALNRLDREQLRNEPDEEFVSPIFNERLEFEIRIDNLAGDSNSDNTGVIFEESHSTSNYGRLNFEMNSLDVVWDDEIGDTHKIADFEIGETYDVVIENWDFENSEVTISVNEDQLTVPFDNDLTNDKIDQFRIFNSESSGVERVVKFDNFVGEDLFEETESSNTFSFEVEEEEATEPGINLISPDQGEVFNLDPGQTSEDISFDWSVEAFEETGTTRFYVNNDEVFTDEFTATFASNPFSHSENLEVGTHEYYVEAETDSHTVTSDTRTFELNERSMDVPEFTLTRPEDGERLNAGGDSSSEVDFEFAVSAETDGEIGLEVLKPGESEYVNVYNDDYSTGVSQSYNPDVTLEDIEYPNEVSGIDESDSYDWRITFDSTETDDSFTSDSQSFTFTTEEITTAQSIVDRVLNFFRGYWEALIDGTSTVGKAFLGLILMLVAGAIGFAAAGTIGAGFGMAAMFLVNTLVGLFPGWIVLALVIGGLAYLLIMRGD